MTDEQNPVISPPADNLQQDNPAASGTVETVLSDSPEQSSSTPTPTPSPSPERSPADSSPAPVSSQSESSKPYIAGEPAHADIQSPLLPAEELTVTAEPSAESSAKPSTDLSAESSAADAPTGVEKQQSAQQSASAPGNTAPVTEADPQKDAPAEGAEEAGGSGRSEGAKGAEATPSEEPKRPSSGLFKKYITENKIFKNREVLRHSYSPRELPHRDEQIDSIAEILAPALQGATPSNILIYGKTGTGKTATVKYVGGELENESSGFTPCRLIHLNCETIDTQYRVLAQIANCVSDIDSKASDRVKNTIPPTGWHTDQVYSELKNILEHAGGLQIIVLDEIDKLVKKSGDDTLYSLTRINSDLTKSRVCIIGISNDLTFKDFLDPRVLSSLSEEELVFPPYNAAQLADILKRRAEDAFLEGAVSDDVISLCAARAAQEHGDARRALDLLRVSGELAEREGASQVLEKHVASAQESIETDTMSECVKTLPVQSKIVLSSMLLLAGSGQKVFTSGQVVGIYRDLVKELDVDCLSHRRVSELINDLTMLGIVSSRVVSYGRHGRTTEIYFDKPTNEIRRVIMNESRFMECSILESLMR